MNATTYIDEADLTEIAVRLTPDERRLGAVQTYTGDDGSRWVYRMGTRSITYLRRTR